MVWRRWWEKSCRIKGRFFIIISSSFLIFLLLFYRRCCDCDDVAGSKVDWIQPQHQFDQLHSPQWSKKGWWWWFTTQVQIHNDDTVWTLVIQWPQPTIWQLYRNQDLRGIQMILMMNQAIKQAFHIIQEEKNIKQVVYCQHSVWVEGSW